MFAKNWWVRPWIIFLIVLIAGGLLTAGIYTYLDQLTYERALEEGRFTSLLVSRGVQDYLQILKDTQYFRTREFDPVPPGFEEEGLLLSPRCLYYERDERLEMVDKPHLDPAVWDCKKLAPKIWELIETEPELPSIDHFVLAGEEHLLKLFRSGVDEFQRLGVYSAPDFLELAVKTSLPYLPGVIWLEVERSEAADSYVRIEVKEPGDEPVVTGWGDQPPAEPTRSFDVELDLPISSIHLSEELLSYYQEEYPLYLALSMAVIVLLLASFTYQIASSRERYYFLSQLDDLTGVINRRGFLNALEKEMSGPAGDDGALILFDIDHFKKINDNYGHPVGDSVLKALAELLQDSVREEDYLARYGGEEFIIFAPGVGGREAQRMAERLRATVADYTFEIDDQSLQITVSGGVAEIKDDLQAALKLADSRLYQAKDRGRNCIVGPSNKNQP